MQNHQGDKVGNKEKRVQGKANNFLIIKTKQGLTMATRQTMIYQKGINKKL